MCSSIVVVRQPFIQISLQLVDRAVNLASERDLIELLQDGLVEAFTDSKRPALPPVQGVICRLAALFETAAVRRFWS